MREYPFVVHLEFLDIFASPSPCIKLYNYDFDNMVSTKIYSLDQNTNCDNPIRVSKTILKGTFKFAEVQSQTKLKFCMYEGAYTVSALKKATYLTMLFLLQKIQDN